MRLSVIIPVLNEAALLTDCLEALAPLRAQEVEIIVVDGGSDDDSVTAARGLSDQLISTARGRAVQMNAGAKIAHGEVLLFLHVDTCLPEHALEYLQAIDFSVFQWGFFSVRLSGVHPVLRLVAMLMTLRSRYTRIATGDQGLFITRHCFEQIGRFPCQPLMEDIEISTRLRAVGLPKIISNPVIISSRRWETYGIYRTILLMWWYRLLYFLGVNATQLARWYYPSANISDGH